MTLLNGVGDEYAERLGRIGVKTLKDFLLLIPRRHEDYSRRTPVRFLRPGMKATVSGHLYGAANIKTHRRGMILTKATLSDGTGQLQLVWFNQKWMLANLEKIKGEVLVAGEVELGPEGLQMQNPQVEAFSTGPLHAGGLIPIYPETEKLTSRWLRSKIQLVLHLADQLEEFLPQAIVVSHGFPPRGEAIRQVHFPADRRSLDLAMARLRFEEMFLLQLAAQRVRRERRRMAAHAVPFDQDRARAFVAALPFRLTEDQRRAAWDILKDMTRDFPMNRLLEGDVGSGKTVVAAMAMHHTAVAGFQSALLAPTEILARQHADVIESLLRPFGMAVGLLVGSTPESRRAPLRRALADGSLQILVGTHALLEEGIDFAGLALLVVDEQQRFGVGQRLALRKKQDRVAHFLSMTATPIPRTLGLTLFGDLDISQIKEMPPGRKPVLTRLVPPQKRDPAYRFVDEQVKQGRQVFVICPLIHESDKLGVRSATQEAERLREQVFPDLADRIGLLHGKLRAQEKDAVMRRFASGELAVLVSTSVVEVGIDIPNASVMMIEAAERFGLAQLHQFRGRVGRGAEQSYCLLFTDETDEEVLERLRSLVNHQSGFEVAEIDLQLRGMGDLYGRSLKQHGKEFQVANLLDAALISDARREADRLLDADRELSSAPALRRQLADYAGVFALD